jgi:thiol:disulfide interchange protein DsbD
VIGASGGHLLPQAGAWMNSVKAVFGVMLLAVAVWLLERVVPPGITLLLWAALAIGSGVYLGALDFAPREGWGQLWKASGAISFVYGVLLLIGAASGAEDPLNPLQNIAESDGTGTGQRAEHLTWYPVNDLADLHAGLQSAGAAGQPVLLDLYADWCISCKVMERSVFPKPEVASQLAQFRLLRADVTDNNAQHKALLDQFGLFGPPSMVFFAEDGRELTEVRVQGEIGAAALATHLAAILKSGQTKNFVDIASNVGKMGLKLTL